MALVATAERLHAGVVNEQPHTCPYCELRFEYHDEIKGHVLHDHPEHAEVAAGLEVHELPHG